MSIVGPAPCIRALRPTIWFLHFGEFGNLFGTFAKAVAVLETHLGAEFKEKT